MDDFTIATSRGHLTIAEALDTDHDMIPTLLSGQQNDKFKDELERRRSDIEKLIQRHLRIPQSQIMLSQRSDWIQGSFNICLPVRITNTRSSRLPRQVIIRFVLPHGVGEPFSPGNVDEKIRCEAATYVWLHQTHPTIPIPRLFGMGVPGVHSFTSIENESWWNWTIWHLRRSLAWPHGKTLSPYFAHRREALTDLGYLLIEHVVEGKMLSSSFKASRHDGNRRANLYRGLARIMLRLASVPLPRIGSWTMDDRGIVSLTNRPLLDLTLFFGKHQIPTDIPRNMTYTSAQPFIHDKFAYQENRMRHQPNSILSKADGIGQLSALANLRRLQSRFWDQRSCGGPFVLTLPDMHQSNIFVDDDWNVTSLIDLEFAPVAPVQIWKVPVWLSDRGVDQIERPDFDEYQSLYNEFVSAIEREEEAGGQDNTYSSKLRQDWSTGNFWYSTALGSIDAYPAIFDQHLQQKLDDADKVTLTQFCGEDVSEFIEKKLEDFRRYEERIHEIFEEAKAREGVGSRAGDMLEGAEAREDEVKKVKKTFEEAEACEGLGEWRGGEEGRKDGQFTDCDSGA